MGGPCCTPNRIVSLVPCITDTLLSLGLGSRVVGRTRYCDGPDHAAIVGGIWDLDAGAIQALAPDLVLMDIEENRQQELQDFQARFPVEVVQVRSLEQSAEFVSKISMLCGIDPPASAPRSSRSEPDIPVLVPVWLRPDRFVGHSTYGDAMLTAAGFRNLVTARGYPEVQNWRELAEGALVLLPTEPYPFTGAECAQLASTLPLARGVRLVEGRDLFWYGTRTPAALAALEALKLEIRGQERTGPEGASHE